MKKFQIVLTVVIVLMFIAAGIYDIGKESERLDVEVHIIQNISETIERELIIKPTTEITNYIYNEYSSERCITIKSEDIIYDSSGEEYPIIQKICGITTIYITETIK